MAFISLGLPDSLLGSAWPSMYESMNVPISYAGMVSMLVAGGTIISSLFSEKLIRRLGTGLVTTISVFLTAVALFMMSFSHNFILLCIWAIPLGLGAGSIDAALNNYVALHYKAKHMNWLHSFWGLGATTGPIIISFWLRNGAKWYMGYRTISIIQFILGAILLFSLPLWKKAQEIVKAQELEKEKISISLKNIIKIRGVKQVLIAFFCYCAVEATTGLWGSTYLVMERGINAEIAARWISYFYFGITFGRFLSGFVTLKLNQQQMIRLGQAILLLGIIFILIPSSYMVLQISFFMIGLGCAPIFPSLLHETPMNFGQEYSQAIMGTQMACAYVGSTFMPPVFGFLAENISYKIYGVFLLLLLILMIIKIERLNRIVRSI